MFGDGISLLDLTTLLGQIRAKNLTLQVKVLDGAWVDISGTSIKYMIEVITKGQVTNANDIRLRLFDNRTG
jgi:hypothetical protein